MPLSSDCETKAWSRNPTEREGLGLRKHAMLGGSFPPIRSLWHTI